MEDKHNNKSCQKHVIRAHHSNPHSNVDSSSSHRIITSDNTRHYYDLPTVELLLLCMPSIRLADNSPFDMPYTGKIPFPVNLSNFQIPLTRPVNHGAIMHTHRVE